MHTSPSGVHSISGSKDRPHTIFFIAVIIATAGAVCSARPANAQDAGQQETRLQEVVVTAPRYVPDANRSATKLDVPLIETPQAISVIHRDQLELLGWQNVDQTVRYTSGVVGENFGADERFDWLLVRGYPPVQYADGLQSAVGFNATTGIDLYSFETVEVVKGPSSVLYGQMPPGGLLNLISRRPQAEASGEVQLQYGSHEHMQAALDSTGALDGEEKYLYRFTGLYRDRQTQTDFVESQRLLLAPAFAMNLSEATKITLLSHYQDDDTGSSAQFLPAQGIVLPNPHGRIPTSRFVSETDFDRFAREQYDIGYEIDHEFGERVSFHQGARYARMETEYFTIFGGGLQPDLRTLDRFTFGFPEKVDAVAVDSRLVVKFSSGLAQHTLLAGLDYRDTSYESAVDFGVGPSIDVFDPVYGQPIAPPDRFSHTEQSQDHLGIYLQDHIKLASWVVTLSGRHDTVDTVLDDLLDPLAPDQEQQDDEFSYRAGVNYVFDSGIAPYVAYSRSFMPMLGREFSGNAFEPTRGEQYEAGIKFEPRGMPEGIRSFMAVALYELTQENALTPDPDNLLFNLQAGEVRVRGFELEGVARFHERLSLNGSYSYTDSEVTRSNGADLGKRSPMVPEHKISLFADYTVQTGALAGFGAGAGVRYVSDTFGDGANEWRNDSTTLVDTTIHYNFSHWRAALNVNNLFDEVIVATCASSAQCFFGPRRTVLASLTRKW